MHSRFHTAPDTPKSLGSCVRRLRDRDAPWENPLCIGSSRSHKAADTPEFLQSCMERLGDRDAPLENQVGT